MTWIQRAAIGLSLLPMAGAPAHANDALFEEMALISTGGPTLPPGELKQGSFVELYNSSSGIGGNVISPGPGPCVLQHLTVTQGQGAWAQISVKTYDFGKVTGARYLGDADDYLSAPSRAPDDPAVTSVTLDGKAWTCMKVMHVDPAKPAYQDVCDDGWTVFAITPEEKKAVSNAVALIEAQCFGKK